MYLMSWFAYQSMVKDPCHRAPWDASGGVEHASNLESTVRRYSSGFQDEVQARSPSGDQTLGICTMLKEDVEYGRFTP